MSIRQRIKAMEYRTVTGNMRTALLTMVIVAGMHLAQAPARAALPSTNAPLCKEAPRIDGVLDDPCWKDAATLSDFFIHGDTNGVQTKDTVVRVTRDDKFLYFAIDCVNPNMRFLSQHGVDHDDPGIGHDDSIEIFLTRDGLGRYYHYVLNYANVQSERRLTIEEGSINRDLSWSYPWITATVPGEKGWTAEAAIPLELLNTREPGDVKLNFMRNKTNVELDMMGAKNSESRACHLWSPVKKTAHEPEAFGVLAGLREQINAPAPFLVDIDGLKTGELAIEGDSFSFRVSATLIGVSPVAGQAVVEVVQTLTNGTKQAIVTTNMALPPRCQTPLALTVPVADFAPKKLALRLTDRTTGMVLDMAPLPFEGTLIKELYPELSFYSHEKTARVKVILDLAPDALKKMALILASKDGKTIAEDKNPTPETILSADAGTLPLGANKLTANLTRNDGKIFGARDVTVTRLKAGVNNESKIDYFRRIVLFKGQPYFPFGMVDGASFETNSIVMNAFIKEFQSAKMNTIFLQTHVGTDFNPEDMKIKFNALADAGINVIVGCGVHSVLKGLEKINSQEEKERLMRERYENKYEPNIRRCIETFKDQPNILVWYGIDEANLGDWRSALFVAKLFWPTIKQADPYHINYSVYARSIPRVPEATDYFEVLGYDIYTYPDWNNIHAKICDPMAAQIAELDIRAAEKRQPIWTMPQPTSLDPGRCPRPLSGREQMCQSYTALIYGSKGLIYFTYTLASSEETWQTLETLGREIEAFAPALLNDPVKQKITYASGTYDAVRWQIPTVPMRLFRFPDGKLMALAVNGKNYPVDLTVKIKGLSGAALMFDKKTAFDVKAEEFTDHLEPYDVRAYALEAPTPPEKPVEVSIATKDHPELEKPFINNEKLITEAQARKNLILNPSFEMQKIPGWPDCYTPHKVVRVRKTEKEPADYSLDKDNPKFGEVALRLTQPEGYTWAGVFGLAVTPKDRDQPHVFSFYARALADKTRIWVGLAKGEKGNWTDKIFELTTEWKRYSMPCPSPGGLVLMQVSEDDDRTYTVWLDGLQLEKGEIPTDFSEK